MKKYKRNFRKQSGIALVIALLFITIFSSLSIAMFSLSSNNILIGENVHQSNTARDCAQSGLEILHYYADQITLPGTTNQSQRFSVFVSGLQYYLSDSFTVSYDSTQEILTIGSSDSLISVNGTNSQGFYAEVTPDGTDGITIAVTGQSGSIERTITAGFTYSQKLSSVFDYGVATKGPMQVGNILIDGTTGPGQANIYIESLNTISALSIQNGQIAGDVSIANSDATVSMSGGQSEIGGESGQSAIDNHVETGVPATTFPVPDPTYFEQYVDGITIDSSTDKNFYKSDGTLENVRIAAYTDPKFTGNIQIMGILYIESPNVVEFGGNCDITGIIVAEGDYTDNSGSDQLTFQGNVSSSSVAALPADARYDGLRDETGTFLLAPGFAVTFGGSFDTLNGCIVANGVVFFGNAGGQIGGSVLNYSDETIELGGSDLLFNRSEMTDTPAGFIPDIELQYDATSYEEIH